jgi:1-phosphofructokinase family hexose kinase
MIVTVTANAMVEHVFPVRDLEAGRAHHPADGWAFATGKGINAARALRDLKEEVTAVVALAGPRGQQIKRLIEADGIPLKAVQVSGENRVGFVTFDRGRVTTVYGPGPSLTDADVDAIVSAVEELLPARLVVLAGSVSHNELYSRLCALKAPVALDFAHPTFSDCVRSANTILAKPNRQECRLLLGEDDPVRAAEHLTRLGAQWAVVTDADGPAFFRTGGVTWRVDPLQVEPVHPVGCGDALCAGLIHAMDRPAEQAVAFAMACGAHNAARPEIGRLDRAACEALAGKIRPERL